MADVSKIRIKLGAIEVEYEGSESFLKEELPSLLTAVSSLYRESQDEPMDKDSQVDRGSGKRTVAGTTGAYAAKLGVKTGGELILAAAAHLTFVKSQEKFSRQELIKEMKTASSYHKQAYVNNLTKYLNSLVKEGKLNEPSKDTYALTAKTRTEMESTLG